MSTIFILEIKDAKNNKIFNFLNDRLYVMGGPMGMIFDVFTESIVSIVRLLKNNFAIFLKI